MAAPPTPIRWPDTLFSNDVLEMILAVSEGPIKGPVNGLQSIFLADTPVADAGGNPNIGPFDLKFYKGENPASSIVPRLGGFGDSVSVGVNLEPGVSVVRSGTQTGIDYIDVRIVISRLLVSNQQGEFPAPCAWGIDIKPHSSVTWNELGPSSLPSPIQTSGDVTRYFGENTTVGSISDPIQRETYVQNDAPTAQSVGAMWFESDANFAPKSWNGSSWITPADATFHPAAGAQYAYWSWTENGQTRRAYIGWSEKSPSGMDPHDYWITPPGVMGAADNVAYVWNGSSWVSSLDWGSVQIANTGHFQLVGKTTSPYIKELRIPVARINEPYDVRVTSHNIHNTTEYFADISWESFQEVTQNYLVFDDLALIQGVFRSSDQFSSMPTFTTEAEGRIIRVPTNYDPVTKIYTGVWDGLFKLEYSDNLAWIVYDLVTNDRYGVSAYQPTLLEKFATYAFGQHCDAHGFTYNDLIQDPRSIQDSVDYICGLAGGRYVDLGNGYATILFDADDQPAVLLFTPENVDGGIFTYSFTDITTRKNDITVSFINPQLNWREDRRRISDDEATSRFGRIPEEFIAVGCINETEAIKRARLRLITAQTEKTIVSFKTNRQGFYASPFDVILIADEDSRFGISGRIKGVIDNVTLTLRDPVAFEAGFDYILSITTKSGVPAVIPLITSSGSTKTLNLGASLTGIDLPDQAVFSIECADTVGIPKAYRITAINEVDGDPDKILVSALEVNRNKWAYVDGTYVPPSTSGSGNVSQQINPVSNLTVRARTPAPGQHALELSWVATTTPLFRFYRIYTQFNGGAAINVGEIRDTFFRVDNVQLGEYILTVVAVSLSDRESLPVSITHLVNGDIREVQPPTNLRLVDGASPTEFDTLSPRFAWDSSPDTYFHHYLVRIVDQGTDNIKRQFATNELQFTYDFELNKVDFGGTASRSFRVEVRAVDATDSMSDPITLIASNPPPSPPGTLSLDSHLFMMTVTWVRPTLVRDWAGAKVHASPTSEFTPDSSNMVYDGPNTTCRTPIKEGQTLYVKVGFYDTFDNSITYSSQFSTKGYGMDPHTISFDNLSTDLSTPLFRDETELTDLINRIDTAGAVKKAEQALAGVVETQQSVLDVNKAFAEYKFYVTAQMGELAGIITQTISVDIDNIKQTIEGTWYVQIQTQQAPGADPPYQVISGFGLNQFSSPGGVTSDFVVQANYFSVIPAYNSANPVARKPVFAIGTHGGIASVGIHGDLVLDGSITANALSVNALSAVSANLGTVTAGIAKSADNKFVIDFTNGTLTVSD